MIPKRIGQAKPNRYKTGKANRYFFMFLMAFIKLLIVIVSVLMKLAYKLGYGIYDSLSYESEPVEAYCGTNNAMPERDHKQEIVCSLVGAFFFVMLIVMAFKIFGSFKSFNTTKTIINPKTKHSIWADAKLDVLQTPHVLDGMGLERNNSFNGENAAREFRVAQLVKKYEQSDSKERNDLLWRLRECAPYKRRVENELRKNNLPLQLYYVMVVESACSFRATSNKGAGGPWQFTLDTGKRYGLSSLERYDLKKSTRAMARYWRDLHGVFGNYTCAIIAANVGENHVARYLLMLDEMGEGVTNCWQLMDNEEAFSRFKPENRSALEGHVAKVYAIWLMDTKHGLT